MSQDRPNLYLLRATDIAARSQTFSHPWNPLSEITGYQLAKSTGLKRVGVNLARIPPARKTMISAVAVMLCDWTG